MFSRDHGINFCLRLCERYAKRFWEFPLYQLENLGVSILLSVTMGIYTLPRSGRKVIFNKNSFFMVLVRLFISVAGIIYVQRFRRVNRRKTDC